MTSTVAHIVVASEDEVVGAVRAACASATRLRIAAQGTWLGAGAPVAADQVLDVSGLRGIIEYVPGDLTLTARAGTTLENIESVTAPHGQWLALDPFGSRRGSLGATVATASAGPLGHTIGLPRDTVLGLAFVDGAGRLARAGGRVVKNVAGFDLVRLMTGAWGTLGVITEVTVRLRAKPERAETVALDAPPAELPVLLTKIMAARIAPVAVELVSSSLAQRLRISEHDALVMQFVGNADAVRAQREEIARVAPVRAVDQTFWGAVRDAEPPNASVVFRLSNRPTELPRLWRIATAIAQHLDGDAHATVSRGVVRCWSGGEVADQNLRPALAAISDDDVLIFERLPVDAWSFAPRSVREPGLTERVRQAFDPERILNPGIMGA